MPDSTFCFFVKNLTKTVAFVTFQANALPLAGIKCLDLIAARLVVRGDTLMAVKILRLPEVKYATGQSRSTIYSKIAKGEFPASISLGARSVGWIESEVQDWILMQIEKSRQSNS